MSLVVVTDPVSDSAGRSVKVKSHLTSAVALSVKKPKAATVQLPPATQVVGVIVQMMPGLVQKTDCEEWL
ncbi:MAG TPA: hypothetical protein VLV78_06465 [Thermoanaerobaculia bacterium]|nr:hypothetical protein [Thermoanaerobaculia bacterium]